MEKLHLKSKLAVRLIAFTLLTLIGLGGSVLAKSSLTVVNKTEYPIQASHLNLELQAGIDCSKGTLCFYSLTPNSANDFQNVPPVRGTETHTWDFYGPTAMTFVLNGVDSAPIDLSCERSRNIPIVFKYGTYSIDLNVEIVCASISNHTADYIKAHPEVAVDIITTVTITTIGRYETKLSPLSNPSKQIDPADEGTTKAIDDLTNGINNVIITNNTNYNLFIDLPSDQSPNNRLSIKANQSSQRFPEVKGLKFMSSSGYDFGYSGLPNSRVHVPLPWNSVTKTESEATLEADGSAPVDFQLKFEYIPPGGTQKTGTVGITINYK